MSEATARCAVHPARPSVGPCPVCGRQRCAADAAATGDACLACRGRLTTSGPPRPDLRATVGAAATSGIAVIPAALIASQYVDSGIFGYVVPVLLGLVIGVAAEWGARKARGTPIRLVAVAYAVVGAGYSFFFLPGRPSSFAPAGKVVPSYVLAAVGAWLWTAPPRVVTRKS